MPALATPESKPDLPNTKVKKSRRKGTCSTETTLPSHPNSLRPIHIKAKKKVCDDVSERPGCWMGLFSNTKDF